MSPCKDLRRAHNNERQEYHRGAAVKMTKPVLANLCFKTGTTAVQNQGKNNEAWWEQPESSSMDDARSGNNILKCTINADRVSKRLHPVKDASQLQFGASDMLRPERSYGERKIKRTKVLGRNTA